MKIKLTFGDKVLQVITYIIAILVAIITLYPFLYVLSCSISNPTLVIRGDVWLLPKQITWQAYKTVLKEKEVWVGYYNTIWYVVVGTFVNIVMTTLAAYPLSRKSFKSRGWIMTLIAFTMFFSGGLIPTYLLVKNLHMVNTRWAMIIPGAISTWNLIIMRTFFESIPESLHEAAIMDGANEFTILRKIILPLSKPVIAVMILFYAVGHWNSYFNALVYINSDKLNPLQIYLRKILITYEDTDTSRLLTGEDSESIGQTIRYATIIVSTVPILCVYPFLQKYFTAGVMIGAIKE